MILLTGGAFRGDDQRTFHVFVAVTAILRAEDRDTPGAEATKSMVTCSPPRGTFLFTLNFLISTPCTPSAGCHDEADALAFGDFDARRFERETLRHDSTFARLALSERASL